MKPWTSRLLVLTLGAALEANCLAADLDEPEADRLFQAVGQNDKSALTRLVEAAEHGDAKAQDRLGLAYITGRGVEKNLDDANKWLRKSAAQGYSYAQFRLGFLYEEGFGVEKNAKEAADWYLKSAEQGNTAACYNLGRMYRDGKDLPKDELQAENWFRIAAENGLVVAQLSLGLLYVGPSDQVKQDYVQAYQWLTKAANAGNAKAIYNLGVLYDNGWGVEKNDATALDLYQKAAAGGEWWAMYQISIGYRTGGLGLPQDTAKADEWYKRFIEAQLAAQRK